MDQKRAARNDGASRDISRDHPAMALSWHPQIDRVQVANRELVG